MANVMLCSPIHLANDMALWNRVLLFDSMTKSYRDFENGAVDSYDCGLSSAPCQSNVTKEQVGLDPEFVYWFDMFVIFVGLTTLSVVGILGNTINIIIIFTSKIANDSANLLYLWLSVSDLLIALNCGCFVAVCSLCYFDNTIALSVFNISFPYLFGNINKISLLSLDFVTVISIQRAVAIIFPFKVSTIFTNKNTKIIVTFLILLTIASNIPLFVAQRPRFIHHPYFDKVISLGTTFMMGLKTTVRFLSGTFYTRSAIDIFFVCLAIPLTIYKLHIQGISRSSMTTQPKSSTQLESSTENPKTNAASSSARELKVIKMSLVVCAVTFTIFCSNMIGQIFLAMSTGNIRGVVWAVNNVGLLLMALGASFNFFLYLAMSDQYRQRFVYLFKVGKM